MYVLIFKKDGVQQAVFDTVAYVDSKNIIAHGKYKGLKVNREDILTPEFNFFYDLCDVKKIETKYSCRFEYRCPEDINFYPEFSLDDDGKKQALDGIIIAVPDQFIDSIRESKQKDGKSFDEALISALQYAFRMGDSNPLVTFFSKTYGLREYAFFKNPKKEKIEFRSAEFVAKEVLGKEIKKTATINEGERKVKKTVNSPVTSQLTSNIDIKKVIAELKEKIVAQDEAVTSVVNNIFTNQRILETRDEDLINSAKANILLDGPTGTGKTLLLKQVANKLSLPIVVRPITSFSTTGYKGADLNDLLLELLNQTNGDVELAERGIVALDEFDKLASKSDRDLTMKLATQHELLSYLSGAKFELDYNGKKVVFDTSKITFVGLGAFNDLRESKIQEIEKAKKNVGFALNNSDEVHPRTYSITQKDYVEAGLMRELVGRFSLLTSTQALTPDKLEQILTESSLSPLKSLEKIGALYNVKITYNQDIVSKIAELAYEDGFGARSLQTIVNNLKNVILTDLLSGNLTKLEITEDLLNKSREISIRSY